MTLTEVARLLQRNAAHCAVLLRAGRFPIRVIDVRPYRFARADVQAYVERGEKTNPLLSARRRRFFGKAAS